MTRVKVCGITRAEDALLAAELGAFAVGFVFWPESPRCIDVGQARAIAGELPAHVLKVGVFVDQPLSEVVRITAEAALDIVQLHGDETVEFARRVASPVVKSVAVTPAFSADTLDHIPDDITVLLDAHDPVKRGGTGQIVDWSLAAAAAARRPVVLSGGLTPENVRAAVAAVRPYAVDLSSGVEAAPGVKDHARLRALFLSIRQ